MTSEFTAFMLAAFPLLQHRYAKRAMRSIPRAQP
jgi:hypothetical protein